MTPKAQATKVKINRWNYIKLISFCTTKETSNKIKRQPTEWEKILVSHIFDKGLIPQIYNSYNSIAKTNKQSDLKMGRGTEQTFFQRRIATRYLKRCSTSLIIMEMQIKTTMRYHLTPVRMATFKKTRNNKCRQGCGEKKTFVHF